MQITEHVFSKKMEFTANTPFGLLKRHAFVFLVKGTEKNCLIDAATKPLLPEVLDFMAETGLRPSDIGEILITHSHSDHTGALNSLKELCGCPVAASKGSVEWIENIDLQFEKRPVPRFYEFVEGSVKVDHQLVPGDVISLGDGSLKAYAAPGHDQGQLVYFHPEDGVLLSADSIPVPGSMPVYDNVQAQLDTLYRLRDIPGVKVLLMSWDDPHYGEEEVRQVLDDAIAYVRHIHCLTMEAVGSLGADDVEAVAKQVHSALNLAPSEFTKMFITTIKAHMEAKEVSNAIF